MNKRCLIIGYGSIGRRHANLLLAMRCHVSLVTTQIIQNMICFLTVDEALRTEKFDYVIIANPTHLHFQTFAKLVDLNFCGVILVEKPLFSQMNFIEKYHMKNVFVAYNLRFHELLLAAKALVQDEEIISFSARVGQYLPTWRKNVDYRAGYSAKKTLGGGVLRELSHELDYALWFCGNCNEVVAAGGHFSELEVDSDDIFSILMRCKNCPIVNIQLDFLSRAAYRDIRIQTKCRTIIIDLIAGTLSVDHNLTLQIENAVTKTYVEQHRAILSGNYKNCCGVLQGLEVVKLIEATELSVIEKKWIAL